jgi:small neutral amino acid transporter SnatA (MarC family)
MSSAFLRFAAAERGRIATMTAAAVLITLLVVLLDRALDAARATERRASHGAATICAVIGLTCGVLLLTLHAADRLSAFLGTTGMKVTRLMGMILAAIAIEMMVGGVTDLFAQLRRG